MTSTVTAQQVWQSPAGEDFLHLITPNGGAVVGYIDANGNYNGAGASAGASFTPTISAAAQPTQRVIDSELTSNFAGSTTITGSIVGVRGNITQAAGNTLVSGFEYGIQGKLTLAGTLNNGSGFNFGIFGQVDTSNTAFVHTSGYLAPIGADFGATSIMASDANANMIALTNTTNCIINSALQFIGNATYAFDLTDLAAGGAHFVVGTTASTAAGCLKVHINGAVRYLQLYSGEA